MEYVIAVLREQLTQKKSSADSPSLLTDIVNLDACTLCTASEW